MTSTSLSLVLFPVIPASDRAKRGSELLFSQFSFNSPNDKNRQKITENKQEKS